MRLTLRTLLAWLDDKLPPAEVKEIGKQVAESTYAKELVDRIHKVTRQRRLSVPNSSGADATDPNLVAGYIDNELDPELVGEFEKKCLTSDVHLAEVSSVHQILSLIGQKAKVPTEARLRMYQLVKGREALRPKHIETEVAERTPVSQPIQPWVAPAPPQRSMAQRHGPLAAVLGLIGVLVWAAWSTLSTPEDLPTYRNIQIASNKASSRPNPSEANAKEPAKPAEPIAAAVPAAPNEATANPEAATKAEANTTKPATAEIPAGAVALAKKPTGVLLRYNPEAREWSRLTEATPLRDQDRILCLEPFRETVTIGTANVDLVADTETWVRTNPKSVAARLSLAHGRVVLHANPSGQPFEIQSGDLTVTITPPAGAIVGVERVTSRSPGKEKADPPELVIHTTDGTVNVGTGKKSATLEDGATVSILPDGTISEPRKKAAPAWLAETAPSPFDQKIGEQFLQVLRPDRQVLSSLVEASENEQKDVCRLVITALKSVGDISSVVPLLNRKGGASASTARRTAIQMLRSALAEGGDSAQAVSEQLKRELGDDLAATAQKLLVGYSEAEAKEEAIYERLVLLLGSTDDAELGIRELAIENLRQLTGRDDLEYDPEKPEGPGLRAWRDLLRNHELKPSTTPAK